MDSVSLVATLVSQHRKLQGDLGGVAKILETEVVDNQKVVDGLGLFAKDLEEHLNLENGIFYVELIKKMKEKGVDSSKTEQFIAEMVEIGKKVQQFLGKYVDSATVADNLVVFKEQFVEIVEVLNLRIESEEQGVYSYASLL